MQLWEFSKQNNMNQWGYFYSKSYDLDYLIQNTACHREMFDLIFEENPKKVLEVGIGTGSMSIFLSYLGFDVTALDNDKQVLSKAKKLANKLNGKVKFLLGDAFKIPFKDNSFDVVFHQGLLEHFSDEEIYHLLDEQLRIGRIVILSVPNNLYKQKDFGNERLLSNEYWDNLLKSRYALLNSFSYNPEHKKVFKGRLIYKIDNTMYLAKLGRMGK